jgi:hypothetical protein
LQPLAGGVKAHAPHVVRERAKCVNEIEVVVDLVQSRLARRAVFKFKRAEARIDFVWCGD